jgi:hypothetical protein
MELGNADPELSQLALDADTSPGPVLSTQTNDESDHWGWNRRSAGASLCLPVLSIAATCPWLIPDATAAASRELPGRIANVPLGAGG